MSYGVELPRERWYNLFNWSKAAITNIQDFQLIDCCRGRCSDRRDIHNHKIFQFTSFCPSNRLQFTQQTLRTHNSIDMNFQAFFFSAPPLKFHFVLGILALELKLKSLITLLCIVFLLLWFHFQFNNVFPLKDAEHQQSHSSLMSDCKSRNKTNAKNYYLICYCCSSYRLIFRLFTDQMKRKNLIIFNHHIQIFRFTIDVS